jgi:ATP-dependent protease ClpP protease subunit
MSAEEAVKYGLIDHVVNQSVSVTM